MNWKILSLLFLLTLIPFTASADVATDVGSGMVASGIDMFFDATSTAIGGNSSNFQTLSGWYNPFETPIVIKTIESTSIFALTIFMIYVFLAICYLVTQSRSPETARTIEFVLNSEKSFNLGKFVKNCCSIMGLFVFVILIITFMLNLAQAASNMMDISSLTAIQNSSQSGVVKFIYSIFWLIISILLAIRDVILTLICSFIVILIFLWKFPCATKPVEIIFLYLVLLIFMQPVMIGTAAIGIGTITALTSDETPAGAAGAAVGTAGALIVSLAVLVLLIVIAALFIIGPFYFHEIFFSLRS